MMDNTHNTLNVVTETDEQPLHLVHNTHNTLNVVTENNSICTKSNTLAHNTNDTLYSRTLSAFSLRSIRTKHIQHINCKAGILAVQIISGHFTSNQTR